MKDAVKHVTPLLLVKCKHAISNLTYSVNKDICVSAAFVSSQPLPHLNSLLLVVVVFFSNLKTMYVCNTINTYYCNTYYCQKIIITYYLLSIILFSLLSPPVWISHLSKLTQPPHHISCLSQRVLAEPQYTNIKKINVKLQMHLGPFCLSVFSLFLGPPYLQPKALSFHPKLNPPVPKYSFLSSLLHHSKFPPPFNRALSTLQKR